MEQEQHFDAVEASISNYIQQGNKDTAVRLLHGLAIRYAEAGAFMKADATRDRIFAVDPFALTEILASGETIDALKHKAICLQHKEVWAGLYSILTRDEGTAFYFSLKKQRMQVSQILFSQGKKNDTLYFIDQGRLKLFYTRNHREEFLRNIRTGEIAGEDTFFQPHLCSSTLLTDSVVTLHSLGRLELDALVSNFPSLPQKLQAYCEEVAGKLEEIHQKKGIERRESKRIRAGFPITIQLVGKTGQPQGGTLGGHISDISVGGIAMSIEALKRESSRMLLGRWLRIQFTIPEAGGNDMLISQNALVTGLRFPKKYSLGGESYTIQLAFEHPLEQNVMNMARRGTVVFADRINSST